MDLNHIVVVFWYLPARAPGEYVPPPARDRLQLVHVGSIFRWVFCLAVFRNAEESPRSEWRFSIQKSGDLKGPGINSITKASGALAGKKTKKPPQCDLGLPPQRDLLLNERMLALLKDSSVENDDSSIDKWCFMTRNDNSSINKWWFVTGNDDSSIAFPGAECETAY